MAKPQSPCVKHRPPEALLLASVFDVAGRRAAERGEVDTDLVRSAGVEVTAQKGMGSLPLDDLVPRPCVAAAGDHRHALALSRMPANRTLELAGVVLDPALGDGEVSPAQRPVLELARKPPVAHIVARDDDQPRGPFVKAMDTARARRAAHRRPRSPD